MAFRSASPLVAVFLAAAALLCLSHCVQAAVAPPILAKGDVDEQCCVPVESPATQLLSVVGMSKHSAMLIEKARTCAFKDVGDLQARLGPAGQMLAVKGLLDVGSLCIGSASANCADINKVPEVELAAVPGLGPQAAADIVKARTCPFLSEEDMADKLEAQDGLKEWDEIQSMFEAGLLCPPKATAQAASTPIATPTSPPATIDTEIGPMLNGLKVPTSGLPEAWGLLEYGYITWTATTTTLTIEVMSSDPMAQSRSFVFTLADLLVKEGMFTWPCGSEASVILEGKLSVDRRTVVHVQVTFTRSLPEVSQEDASAADQDVTSVSYAINGLKVPVSGLPEDWSSAGYGFLKWDQASDRVSLTVPSIGKQSTVAALSVDFATEQLTLSKGGFSWPSAKFPSLVLKGAIPNEVKKAGSVEAVMTRSEVEEVSTQTISVGWLLSGKRITVMGLPEEWGAQGSGYVTWDASAGILTLVVPSKKTTSGTIARKFFFYSDDASLKETTLKWSCRQYTALVIEATVLLTEKRVESMKVVMTRSQTEVTQVTNVGIRINGARVPVSGLPATWNTQDYGLLAWDASSSALTLRVPSKQTTGRVLEQKFYFYGGDFALKGDSLTWACRHFPDLVLKGKYSVETKTISGLMAVRQEMVVTQQLQEQINLGQIINGQMLSVVGLPQTVGATTGQLVWTQGTGELHFIVTFKTAAGAYFQHKYDFLKTDLSFSSGGFAWKCTKFPSLVLYGKMSADRMSVWGLQLLMTRRTIITTTTTFSVTTVTWMINKMRVPVSGLPETWGTVNWGFLTAASGMMILTVPTTDRFGQVIAQRFAFDMAAFKTSQDSFTWTCRKYPSLVLQGKLSADRKSVHSLQAVMVRSQAESVLSVSVLGASLNNLKVPVVGAPPEWGSANFGFLLWNAVSSELVLAMPSWDPRNSVIAQKFIFNGGDCVFSGNSFTWRSKLFPSLALYAQLSADRRLWVNLQAVNTRSQQPAVVAPKANTYLRGQRQAAAAAAAAAASPVTAYAWMLNALKVTVQGMPPSWGAASSGNLKWDVASEVLTLDVPSRDPRSSAITRFKFYGADLTIKGNTLTWPCKDTSTMGLRGTLSADKKSIQGLQAVMTRKQATRTYQLAGFGQSLNGRTVPVKGLPSAWGTKDYGQLEWVPGQKALALMVSSRDSRQQTLATKFLFYEQDLKIAASRLTWPCRTVPSLALYATMAADQRSASGLQAIMR